MQVYTKILLGMLIGILLGFFIGPNSWFLPQTGVHLREGATIYQTPDLESRSMTLPISLEEAKIIDRVDEPPTWLQVEWEQTKDERELPTFGWVRAEDSQVHPYSQLGQNLVDMTEWIGRLFIALIKMVVIPLVFFSLTVGVASLGDVRRLGRMGGRTIGIFISTTVLALVIGVTLANLIKPGGFLSPADQAQLVHSYEGAMTQTIATAAEAPSFVDQLIAVVPANPIASLAQGEMLQIIFFALMLGIALTMLPSQRAQPIVQLLDTGNEAMVVLVHIAMKFAPIGVAALLFKVVGTTGLSVLLSLAVYGLVVLLGLLLHLFLVYGSLIRLAARLHFFAFLRALRPAMLLAFSTSSSSATLPVTKECMEENVHVSNQVSSFVLPLGATINMDATALYQGVAALFIAQIYDQTLSLADQLTIITSATLASIGAAGVPGAGMVTLTMVLTAVGIPVEGIALILGLDRLLDMFRTTINVVGDATTSAVVARWEGEKLYFSRQKFEQNKPHPVVARED